MKKILSILLLAALVLAACSDDTGIRSSQRIPGELYFTLSSSDWAENGQRATRVSAPAEITSSAQLDEPLYLHCEIAEGINLSSSAQDTKEQATTRGTRYVGPVFNAGSYGVSSFGIYAKVGDHVALPKTTVLTRDWFDEGTDGGSGVSEWRVKNSAEINDYWGEDDRGFFYGFVPGSDNWATAGVDVEVTGSEPTLTYTMPENEANQMDIMTAKDDGIHLYGQTGITKEEKNDVGVQLAFTHVLAAIRFKVKSGNNLTCRVNDKTYYVHLKSIAINDVYNQGTCPIVTDLPTIDLGEGTTGVAHLYLWDLGSGTHGIGNTTGSCSTTITRSRADILADTERLITPDEHCFMLLPQIIPDGVKATFTCDLCSDEACSTIVHSDVTFAAPLCGIDGDNNSGRKEWWPGYTYTYAISDDAVDYVFSIEEDVSGTLTSKNGATYTVPAVGESHDVEIKSYKYSVNGTAQAPVNWTASYSTDGGTSWTSGMPDWTHLVDITPANVGTAAHAGAIATANERNFDLVIDPDMVDKDLSLFAVDNETPVNRTTANSYIVKQPGTYRIPLIYGNAWKNGSENTKAYISDRPNTTAILKTFQNYMGRDIKSGLIRADLATYSKTISSASLVWQDVENLVSDVSLVWEDKADATDGYIGQTNGYLQFEVTPAHMQDGGYGNAVVAIKDSEGKVVWSWHIWVSDPVEFTTNNTYSTERSGITYSFTGVNLGWVDAKTGITLEPREVKIKLVQAESGNELVFTVQQNNITFDATHTNALYQWGRKDPLPGVIDNGSQGQNKTVYGTQLSIVSDGLTTTRKIEDLIQNPHVQYIRSSGYLLYLTDSYYRNLWSINSGAFNQHSAAGFRGKTVYDPSPAGYSVPPPAAYANFGVGSFDLTSRQADGYFYVDFKGNDFKLPFVGYRDGDNSGAPHDHGSTSYYLQSAALSHSECRMVRIARHEWGSEDSTTKGWDDSHLGDRNRATQVRAIQEPTETDEDDS